MEGVHPWPAPAGWPLRVVFPGRFQPFHPGHLSAWRWLCARFGVESVWITTSDHAEDGSGRYPLRFVEKREWMSGLGVPAERVVLERSPYKPVNIPDGVDPGRSLFIVAVSTKDQSRLSGPYFQALPEGGFDTDPRPMSEGGYVVVVPGLAQVSGSQIREVLRDSGRSLEEKRGWLEQVYPGQRVGLLEMLLGRV